MELLGKQQHKQRTHTDSSSSGAVVGYHGVRRIMDTSRVRIGSVVCGVSRLTMAEESVGIILTWKAFFFCRNTT